MHNFKELKVWQKGRKLVKEIYVLTNNFPKEEVFVMTSQMRRAAVSIPSNIAEGAGRGTDKDFSRFIDLAMGSSYELESLIYVGFDLEYFSEEELKSYTEKIQEVQKMLFHFKNHLNH